MNPRSSNTLGERQLLRPPAKGAGPASRFGKGYSSTLPVTLEKVTAAHWRFCRFTGKASLEKEVASLTQAKLLWKRKLHVFCTDNKINLHEHSQQKGKNLVVGDMEGGGQQGQVGEKEEEEAEDRIRRKQKEKKQFI